MFDPGVNLEILLLAHRVVCDSLVVFRAVIYTVTPWMLLPGGDLFGRRLPNRFRQEAYSSIIDDAEAQRPPYGETFSRSFSSGYRNFRGGTGRFDGAETGGRLPKRRDRPSSDENAMLLGPILEVNERMSTDRHPERIVPRRSNGPPGLVLATPLAGRPSIISKRDVEGAFKLIHISNKGLLYTGCRFSRYVRLYLSLIFGRRQSPANWGVISTLLMQFIAARSPSNAHAEGPGAYIASQYVDDGAFVDPWLSFRPQQCVSLMESASCLCLRPATINIAKRDIGGLADATIELLGTDVCTVGNTSALPDREISRDEDFLCPPDFDPDATRIQSECLQELRGRVGHWPCCNSSLGVGVRIVGRLLVTSDGVVNPRGSLRGIKQAYLDFWSSLETIRIHMSTADYRGNTYTADLAGTLTLDARLSPLPHRMRNSFGWDRMRLCRMAPRLIIPTASTRCFRSSFA